jgi:tetratricopeptide (TPR) repeat protein
MAYIHRGYARDDLKDHEGAIEDYTQAIQLDPQFALAYYNRGDARNSLGDTKGAEADWAQARRINVETEYG